jgi:hypothetical protein
MTAPDYPLSGEMLAAMLTVTRITSENMQSALYDHLVLGDPQTVVAERYGYKKQQIGVHVKSLREKFKPAFDAYAAAAARGPRRPAK